MTIVVFEYESACGHNNGRSLLTTFLEVEMHRYAYGYVQTAKMTPGAVNNLLICLF